MRLFVSVDLPDGLADEVRALQEEFADADGLRFTEPEQVHVTLKFLGEVDRTRLDEVESATEDAIDAARVDPFDVTFGGLGVFPSLDYISVVWFGVREGDEELTRLHEAIEEETTAIGFDPEDHEFTPHVTLARMEHAGGKDLVQELVRERDPTIGEMRVREVRLTESDLGPGGPEYSTVTRFAL